MIKGNTIYLRPVLLDDVEYLNKWKNDKEIFLNLGGGFMPISIDQQKKWMENFIDNTGNNKRFMIVTNEGAIIGFVGLYEINSIHRICSLGIYIGEKDYWGRKIGTEACELIIDFAKKTLNLRKIGLKVVDDNKSAISMYIKLGFKECGRLVEERYIDGEYKDVLLMEKFI